MSSVPYNIRGQLVTPSYREEISLANAQTIRDEAAAIQVNFDERTASLRSLRLARDADLKKIKLVPEVGPHTALRASQGG
jgi:hypothetical protein